MTEDDAAELRDALAQAGYTVDAVRDALGHRASAALDRNETTPGLIATDAGSPLSTLIRLWPLQAPVPRAAAAAVLPVGLLLRNGFLQLDGDDVLAEIDVRPYADEAGDWWIVADLTPGLDGRQEPVSDDHVLGVNAASSTLAQLTIREPVGTALDLGTGCGVQALHLARHCERIVATDVNPRALRLAAITAQLNRIEIDLREGDLFEPVQDAMFDLVVTNPPFVVSPGGHHVYRDSGLSGDELCRRVVTTGADRLSPGGTLQSLANWMHVHGEDWQDRVGTWISETACDAWVIEREVLDPAEYVELWLRDAGEVGSAAYRSDYQEWLEWFDRHDVEGIGFGWINVRNTGADQPVVTLESWPHAVEQPIGGTVAAWLRSVRDLPSNDSDLGAARLTVRADVQQEQIGRPGDEDPEHVLIRQHHGLRRAARVGTAEAGLVGACDGTLPVNVLIDALATVLDEDADELRHDLLPRVRELVRDGFLIVSS